MEEKRIHFYTANEVSVILDISLASAYRVVKTLNIELEKEGFSSVRGRVSKKFFDRKFVM